MRYYDESGARRRGRGGRMIRLGFLGAGNMATAMIGGITKAELPVSICAYDPNMDKCKALSSFGVCAKESAEILAQDCDYLVLAIKPQNFEEALSSIRAAVKKKTVFISIAAGITPQYISSALGFETKVVQVMPNTPLLLGAGATALSKNELVSEEEFAFARSLFNCAGITEVIPNDKMNEVIALNGSSPAFLYLYAQQFIRYGVSAGLDEDVCLRLFAQSLAGSAKMLTDSGETVDELIEMVSSKGGTTIAGLAALRENGIEKAVTECCQKCTARAYELTK